MILDVSTPERKFESLMYPVSMVFRWDDWQRAFIEHAMKKGDFAEKWGAISAFKAQVLDNFTQY